MLHTIRKVSCVPDRTEAKKTSANRVYEMLRDAISSGKYQVGDRLTESNLAKDVDVSRTPVREALQRLAAEGFVDISPHAGAVVKGWTQTDVREVFETRALIESAAAGLAARNACSGIFGT